MKRVFRIKVEEKGNHLICEKHEFNVFSKDMTQAIKKVQDVISNRLEIIEAEWFCDVDEDRELKNFQEE